MDQESQDQKLSLLKTASFGRQVEQFWDSDVGKYLQHHAATCYSSAIEELKSVKPTDVDGIIAAQMKCWQAEQFIQWMTQAIEQGLEALEILEGTEDADSSPN